MISQPQWSRKFQVTFTLDVLRKLPYFISSSVHFVNINQRGCQGNCRISFQAVTWTKHLRMTECNWLIAALDTMLSVLLLSIKTSFIQLSPRILRPGHPLVFFAWLVESVKCSQKGRTVNITTTENKLYLKADYSATPLWVAHYTESFFSYFFFSADRQWCVPITSDERIKSASRISVQVYPRCKK